VVVQTICGKEDAQGHADDTQTTVITANWRQPRSYRLSKAVAVLMRDSTDKGNGLWVLRQYDEWKIHCTTAHRVPTGSKPRQYYRNISVQSEKQTTQSSHSTHKAQVLVTDADIAMVGPFPSFVAETLKGNTVKL
jgi:hypothetical protein